MAEKVEVVVKTNENSCFVGNWKCGSLMTSEIVVLKTNVNCSGRLFWWLSEISVALSKQTFMKQMEICESRKMLHRQESH